MFCCGECLNKFENTCNAMDFFVNSRDEVISYEYENGQILKFRFTIDMTFFVLFCYRKTMKKSKPDSNVDKLKLGASSSNDLKAKTSKLSNRANSENNSSSHISDNLIPDLRKMESQDEKESVTKKTCHKKFVDFFQEARVQKFSVKTPNCCKLSKGLVLGIIFLIFFSLIIMWIVFSTENFESDDKVLQSFNKKRCNFSANCTNGTFSNDKGSFWANNFFILLITVLIVLCIILFVFGSAACKYFYQKAKYPANSQTVCSFIFGEQNKRDSLFYLEQNEKMHSDKSHECCENNFYANTDTELNRGSKINFIIKFFKDSTVGKKNIPIIIVNDST